MPLLWGHTLSPLCGSHSSSHLLCNTLTTGLFMALKVTTDMVDLEGEVEAVVVMGP